MARIPSTDQTWETILKQISVAKSDNRISRSDLDHSMEEISSMRIHRYTLTVEWAEVEAILKGGNDA